MSNSYENVRATIETSEGSMSFEFFNDKAPGHVKNFVDLAEKGFYDNTVFHRVISNFMIQGGGLTPDLERKTGRDPIKNEATNGLKNVRGSIAMARTGDPHSAQAQFFINVVDNDFLDHKAPSGNGWGYAVFGRVVDGMDVVDAIRAVPTAVRSGRRDVPVEPVLIQRASVVTPE